MSTPKHTQEPDAKFTIVFAIWPGMTHLDFTGPHQFLSRTPNSQTIVATPAGGAVEADGLVFADTVRIADVRSCDLICVPGGVGATKMAQDAAFIAEIRRLALGARYITSVCTGSLILGAAGLLKGKRAACHWAYAELLPLFGAIHDPRTRRARRQHHHRRRRHGRHRLRPDRARRDRRRGNRADHPARAGVCACAAVPSGRPELAPPNVRARYEVMRQQMMPRRAAPRRKRPQG